MVCQGLQSCLEPGFLETRATIDKFANFSPFPKNPITNLESESKSQEQEKEIKVNDQKDLLCWSFLQQSLLNNNNNNNNNNGMEMEVEKTEEVYVHPLSKLSSSSTLSTQSLEMCTEGLGSETGSNNSMDDDDEIMAVDLSCDTQQQIITDSNSGPERGRRIQHSRRKKKKKKKEKGENLGNYPPPLLTLISGTDGIQLKPHREDGRLVLKAVPFSHKSCFLAERTGGRLRLFSLSNDDNNNRNTNTEDYVSCEEEEEEEEKDEKDCIEGNGGGGAGAGNRIEIENNDQNSTEEFARPSSRCSKEEDPRKNIIRGLNWEPVWVAIS